MRQDPHSVALKKKSANPKRELFASEKIWVELRRKKPRGVRNPGTFYSQNATQNGGFVCPN
jgi:hypothetical protein